MIDALANALPSSYNAANTVPNLYRKVCYCPSASVQDVTIAGNPNYWWRYDATTSKEHRAGGYVWLISRQGTTTYYGPGGNSSAATMTRNFLYKSNLSWTNNVSLSDSEMIADVIISTPNGTLTDQFHNIIDNSELQALPYGMNSNHMAGSMPQGDDILFQDTHADWRNFSKCQMWITWTSGRHLWF